MEPDGPLARKTLVIIGGTTGLGLSAAQACLAAGGSLVAVGREKPSIDLGPRARTLVADATDPRTAPEAIAMALREFGGRLDALYHVAGGSGRSAGDGPLHECSDEGWQQTLGLNLTSVFYSNRAAARQFLQQGSGGAVLNMASVLAFSPSPQFFSTHAYAAAKAGIIGLTKAAAAQYAAQGIRFNAIAPGLVETPMSGRACGDEEIVRFVRAKQPLDGGRVGQASDLDAAVVFFVSDQSRFVTGQVLAVDGGWSVTG
jgi:NAD(P)-dependent dehydrogenase (short-subunit alcohol dehydrogenase family)